eukprot:6063382-Prymnesium_polylepis.1
MVVRRLARASGTTGARGEAADAEAPVGTVVVASGAALTAATATVSAVANASASSCATARFVWPHIGKSKIEPPRWRTCRTTPRWER